MSKRKLPILFLSILLLCVALSASFAFAQDNTPTPVPYTLPPGSGLITSGLAGELQTLTGSGSTAAVPLWTNWAETYSGITGVTAGYTGNGSGAGITAITDCTVQWAGSDSPMSDDQLAAAKTACGSLPILHIPVAIMGVSVVVNIPELNGVPLHLSPEVAAKLFLGQITSWNDPLLIADNIILANVNQPVAIIVRSDGSGTTNIFTSWLLSASPTWQASGVGSGSAVQWPAPSTLAQKGNSGVAGGVNNLPYSVGYVETTYAVQNGMVAAWIQNSSGKWIESTPETISASAEGVTLPPDMRIKLVNSANPVAYPISGFTWALVRPEQPDLATGQSIARFVWYAVHDGQALNASLGYAPLPLAVIQYDERALATMTFGGSPVLPPDLYAHVTPDTGPEVTPTLAG